MNDCKEIYSPSLSLVFEEKRDGETEKESESGESGRAPVQSFF